MSTITITKTYDDGTLLEEADLDPFKNNTETFFNTTKLNDDNIQNAGITASEKLQDGSITAAKMGTTSVGESNLASSAVTTITLNDLSVTTAKITDSSVTTAKIADSGVGTADFDSASVTYAKTTLNYEVDDPTGSNTYPSLVVNTTTRQFLWEDMAFSGRPVLIQVFIGRNVGSSISTATVSVDVVGPVISYAGDLQFSNASSDFKLCGPLNFFVPATDNGNHDITLFIDASGGTFSATDTTPTRPTVLILEL